MSSSSDNLVILITGGNTGIGYATTQAILSSPSKPSTIIITSRSLERSAKAADNLQADQSLGSAFAGGSKVVPKELDIDSDESISKLHDEVKKEFGKVDVLINNAGVNLDFEVAKGNLTVRQGFINAFSTNVVNTHIFTETFADLLLQSETRRLIFLSSGIGSLGDHSNPHVPVNHSPPAGWPKKPIFNSTTYRTSKTAMNMMILEWARTLKNDNVKVHLIDPGFLATGLGGIDQAVLKEKGAQDPSVGGKFIKSVIDGARDEDVEKLISQEGIVPW
ncbi:uncharacterized protein I303_106956 [Kwoniella dejecticola CBS 10117]|uniref:Short-chain dehydrogenase n=1 Tax=Kwoniella dejecticola CBS 10117 TaxID=1296121 RepID=A0A1A5ZYB1_9TREE|nr:uncharacterized protein I303_06357 [Kwoniella dejecticola CBS 10117]OBR82800.1 hypothetical protein I303_06357 [Kwoniella dejecticola CBS 10117]